MALVAQFYPKKHPENWGMLLACLIFYCIGSTFLSLFSALYEEDACFITRPKKVDCCPLPWKQTAPLVCMIASLCSSPAQRHTSREVYCMRLMSWRCTPSVLIDGVMRCIVCQAGCW